MFLRKNDIDSDLPPSPSLASAQQPSFQLASWLFLRLLGLTYFFAFISYWVQFPGLIGPEGVLPIAEFLQAASTKLDWWERFWLLPTLCWFSSSPVSLHIQFFIGSAASILLFLGWRERLSASILWLLYLSLSIAGQVFFGFQWDSLLLEVGLIALFFAPSTANGFSQPRSVCARFVFLWLLFRLMFASGAVKLLSGDPSWRDLSALQYHYFTQPLPSFFAYYAHRAPTIFHTASCVLMFVIELLVPFLIFGTRHIRHLAATALIVFQLLISVTGNYAYFNLLTIALCILVLDDALLARLLPHRLQARATPEKQASPAVSSRMFATQPILVLLLFLGSVQLWTQFFGPKSVPKPINTLVSWTEPFRSINRYGLFAVMTTERPEIILEGSNDGEQWQAYYLKWKPQDVTRAPSQVAPHQPRLDWQLWFAALSNYRQNPWFLSLVQQLLNDSKPVLSLFETNPFPDAPPKYIRALIYNYEFTSRHEKATEGKWWRRELVGFYLPPVTLENFRKD